MKDVDGKPRIVGYAAVFNSLSEDLGGFREIIRPGAFANCLPGADVLAVVAHDRTKILGRTTSATLDLTEDDHGLRFAINPPNTRTAEEVIELIRRGDLGGCSFRFYMFEDENLGQRWEYNATGIVREITEIARIADVTITADPAYKGTEVSLRSLDHCRGIQRQRDAWSTKAHFALRLAEAD